MAEPMLVVLVSLGLPVVAAAVVGSVLLVQWALDPGRPATSAWQPADLSRLLLGVRGAAHRAFAGRACDLVAADRGRRPRHALDAPPKAWFVARPLGLSGCCPGCEGVRCRGWWEGRDCRVEEGARPAYAVGLPLPRPGRHSVAARVAAYRRRVQLAYRRQAVLLDPAWYAYKLGRPVQLAGPARRLP